MELLITISQFILSLSILIILHECGHFFPAKWFNTKVEKFYLFFDPYFSLFKIQKGDTEYGIGWLPLGGYVKIAGMVDESFDLEALKEEPKEWEFRAKPAWQRLIIMLGGVTVNFILGILIFAIMAYYWGEEFIPNESVKYGIAVEELGKELGLQDGDLVLSVGGVVMEQFESSAVSKEIIFNEAKDLVVRRDGRELSIPVPEGFVKVLSSYDNRGQGLFIPRFPSIIVEVVSGSNAEKGGLKVGDRIIGVNGEHMPFFHQSARAIGENPNAGVVVDVLRNVDTLSLQVMTDENGKVGFFNSREGFWDIETKKYAAGPALFRGVNKSVTFITDQIKAFGQMFRGKIKAKDSLGSFISIGGMFGSQWDWRRFWGLTAMLSVLLGFINLMPIPALDGGHVMFLLWEVITGMKPSDKVLEYSTMGGFILLMCLMVYVLGIDIMRLF